MRLTILFLFITSTLTFGQVGQKLKLRQLELSTDPSPSSTYLGGYGQVPLTDENGNLTYALPFSGRIPDFHQGIHVGVSNAWKERGLFRNNNSDYHIGLQWPPNMGWGNAAGVVQATLARATWAIAYFGGTSQVTTNCPMMNFYKIKTDGGTTVLPPVAGDPLMFIRGQSHRGLVDTLRATYDYSNGYSVLNVVVDSVLITGELATKTNLWARRVNEGNNPISSGIVMIELSGARSEIKFPTYLSTRNDAGGPVNILSTNNVGTLRSHPVADIYPTASGTLDFPSTAAGDVSELTINVTNAVVGRPVIVGSPASIPDKGTFSARVTAAGVVTVRFANNDLSVAKDPASGTFTITVIQ